MGLYYTTTITREKAINKIVEKRIEQTKKEIEYTLNNLTNSELEELLDKYEVGYEYENFKVEEKGDNNDSI